MPSSGISGYIVWKINFSFLRNRTSASVIASAIPLTMNESFSFPKSLTEFFCLHFVDHSHFGLNKMKSQSSFSVSLISKDDEHLFRYFLVILFLLLINLFSSTVHTLI